MKQLAGRASTRAKMIGTDRWIFSPNIIDRRVQRTHAQYGQAVDAANRLSIQGHRFCVTSQNLIELWAISTRPIESNGLGFSPAEADRVVPASKLS